MNKILLTLVFIIALGKLSAQNIVFNGSFEIYQTCPKYESQIKLAGGWDRPSDGTPDFFHECCGTSKIGVPNNFGGTQEPRTGKGYAGLYLYQSNAADGYREYITNELKSTLVKGKVYYVKFYVALAKLSGCAVGNIGVLFTEDLTKTGNSARLEAKPQLNYAGNIIADSGNWVEMLWTYKAKGNEKYMTIGNFDKAEKCAVKFMITPNKDLNVTAYYYIDDICVEEVVDGQPCRCIQDTNSFIDHAAAVKISKDNSVIEKAPPAKVITPDKSTILETVSFVPDKASLLSNSCDELNKIADYLYFHPKAVVDINGYTDNTGINVKNLILSKERAKAVALYLGKRGVDTSRTKFKGHGCEDPVRNNYSPEGREQNRRIEYKIHEGKWRHKERIFKTQDLKGGYKLVFKQHDSINYLCTWKNGIESEVSEHESDTTMKLDVLGYLYADFDSTMVIATHIGTDPIKVEVINKRTGGTMMYGKTPFYMDTIKGLMMIEGSGRRGGKFVLYDFNTNKSELFIEPQNTHCFCCYCWKLVGLTDTEVKIEYLDMDRKSQVKTYPRK